jgi:hypothetical protein
MHVKRRARSAVAALCAAAVAGNADARELTYGSWAPPRDAFNTKVLSATTRNPGS